MKKCFLLLFVLTLFIACSDNDEPSLQSKLIGEWSWIETSGGIGGWYYTPESTGEERSVIFEIDKVKSYVDGILVSETYYSIDRVESPHGELIDLIIYENGIIQQRVVLNGNDLIMYDYNVSDGFQSEYLRN